ncbi:MAG: SDR family oxidoreductase [Alphaproteobacteria bacterium]|nr:SDR family oxidoreductase [Alphaproteobacteria bacterium]TAD90680.1 MAG: SDR family oxidoreductase [Alphaproteobacteria bacterium]
MTKRLAGRTVLVTAAGQGIGRAIALAAAAEAATVIATDIDPARLDSLEGVERLTLDVRDPNAIQSVCSRLGTIDVLMNVAGVVHHGSVLDATDQEWQAAFEINVLGMARMIQAVLPGMIAAGGGVIVNIASVASSIRGFPNRCIYGATKGGVIGLTRSVAVDFVGQGIRCNAICPGTVDTPSLSERVETQAARRGTATEAVRQEFVARQPMGRLGTAEEVAQLAVYLASADAAFITGQELIIDGGITA